MYFLTLDLGTTNLRVSLWDENKNIIKQHTSLMGVRNTAISGSNSALKAQIHDDIITVLNDNHLELADIEAIIASGMITSNVGITEIPHIKAPAGMYELASGLEKRYFQEIVDKEIYFIPGIKNNVNDISKNNYEMMDIMRGEETEAIGLTKRLNITQPAIIILPGSHGKFILMDENGMMKGCITTLSGELVSTITNNTIIADSLNQSFANEIIPEKIIEGYKLSKRTGINRTAFLIRILGQFTDYTDNEKSNVLLGAILYEDLLALKNSSAFKTDKDMLILICAKDILRDAYEIVFKEDSYFNNVFPVDSQVMNNLSGFGALCIYEEHKNIDTNKECKIS